MDIKVKKLSPTAIIPTRAHSTDAGVDLYANVSCMTVIAPHQTVKIGTGIAIATPENYFAGVFARSGLSTNEGLRPANCTGVIDTGYRGECIVALHNDSDTPRMVTPGEKIAQLIFIPCPNFNFVEVDELDNTDRGATGFGASGK